MPTAESCNSLDDDCNGQTDEGPICDDGDACTVNDVCTAGACVAGKPVACDGGQCILGSCDKATGKCAFATKGDGSGCDDGNPCTLGDVCAGAVCLGQPKPCDDQDPCTVDSCVSGGACVAVVAADGKPCDDGQPCTGGESCKAGLCQGGGKTAGCQCATNADCAPIEDGKLCNGTLYCDKSTVLWACKLNAASVFSCPAGDKTCVASVCKEPTGLGTPASCAPSPLPDGTTCSDGVASTVGDVCEAGVCKGVGL